jgi:hypothetical protein
MDAGGRGRYSIEMEKPPTLLVAEDGCPLYVRDTSRLPTRISWEWEYGGERIKAHIKNKKTGNTINTL